MTSYLRILDLIHLLIFRQAIRRFQEEGEDVVSQADNRLESNLTEIEERRSYWLREINRLEDELDSATNQEEPTPGTFRPVESTSEIRRDLQEARENLENTEYWIRRLGRAAEQYASARVHFLDFLNDDLEAARNGLFLFNDALQHALAVHFLAGNRWNITPPIQTSWIPYTPGFPSPSPFQMGTPSATAYRITTPPAPSKGSLASPPWPFDLTTQGQMIPLDIKSSSLNSASHLQIKSEPLLSAFKSSAMANLTSMPFRSHLVTPDINSSFQIRSTTPLSTASYLPNTLSTTSYIPNSQSYGSLYSPYSNLSSSSLSCASGSFSALPEVYNPGFTMSMSSGGTLPTNDLSCFSNNFGIGGHSFGMTFQTGS